MMTIYTNHFYHKVTVAVTGTTVMMTIYTNHFYHKVTVAVTQSGTILMTASILTTATQTTLGTSHWFKYQQACDMKKV